MTQRRLLLLILGVLAFVAVTVVTRALVVGIVELANRSADEPAWSLPDTVPRPDPTDWTTLVDLEGEWAFRIGDRPEWAEGTEGAGWDSIAVPAIWENEGYHGYDGYAWYRRSFALDTATARRAASEPIYLLLGRIDDSDEAFVNGVRIGRTGLLPPAYDTGYYAYRIYAVPLDVLEAGDNTVAVRVYDGGREGGIMDGPIALATTDLVDPAGPPFVADLTGLWRFSPGDDPGWARPGLEDAEWDSIRVPGAWERQGYRALGGFAWYRTSVTLSDIDAREDLVLVVGAIDDLDQAFVNGTLVGETGDLEDGSIEGEEWLEERAYPVPAGLLRPGENVVAIRVYDGPNEGGIHRGPVGLMTENAYERRRRDIQ